ncbi:MAG: FliI/YscN family ATPase, partial [Pseudomonadota bacterium]
IRDITGKERGLAEVVSVETGSVSLIPVQAIGSVRPGDRIDLLPERSEIPVGDAFSGRLVDATGQALDDAGPLDAIRVVSAHRPAPKPLARTSQLSALETGVRAIDALLPVARGQRIGIFAAAGVGKTTLVTQMARQTRCDHCILCLVGERGREVEAMWSHVTGGEPNAKVTAVIATSDESASLRVRAVEQALALAEYWRDAGRDVLIVFDSITRYAMALREIGLAAGLPPTLRAYTPNVFSMLPRIVERCGALKSGGSITGLFTVLSETDDIDDPIVEAMKSFLDGHLVLSRELAEVGHFPAIDVPASISRLAPDLFTQPELGVARQAAALLATLKRSRLLIESGMYQAGSDPQIDRALSMKPSLDDFTAQDPNTSVSSRAARQTLSALLGDGS